MPEESSSVSRMLSFLFTDVEGSTRLWEQDSERMSISLAHHNHILSSLIDAHHGKVFKTVGDGFCAVFNHANDALQAAIDAQTALGKPPPENLTSLKVRMGLHSG